eukprot:scaffold1817_cov250-Pinguiococcus_pyrenoidosus.AAC.8
MQRVRPRWAIRRVELNAAHGIPDRRDILDLHQVRHLDVKADLEVLDVQELHREALGGSEADIFGMYVQVQRAVSDPGTEMNRSDAQLVHEDHEVPQHLGEDAGQNHREVDVRVYERYGVQRQTGDGPQGKPKGRELQPQEVEEHDTVGSDSGGEMRLLHS